jgi:hypothetical protein
VAGRCRRNIPWPFGRSATNEGSVFPRRCKERKGEARTHVADDLGLPREHVVAVDRAGLDALRGALRDLAQLLQEAMIPRVVVRRRTR